MKIYFFHFFFSPAKETRENSLSHLHIHTYFSDFRSYDCFAKHRTLRVTIISMRTSFQFGVIHSISSSFRIRNLCHSPPARPLTRNFEFLNKLISPLFSYIKYIYVDSHRAALVLVSNAEGTSSRRWNIQRGVAYVLHFRMNRIPKQLWRDPVNLVKRSTRIAAKRVIAFVYRISPSDDRLRIFDSFRSLDDTHIYIYIPWKSVEIRAKLRSTSLVNTGGRRRRNRKPANLFRPARVSKKFIASTEDRASLARSSKRAPAFNSLPEYQHYEQNSLLTSNQQPFPPLHVRAFPKGSCVPIVSLRQFIGDILSRCARKHALLKRS